MFQHTAARRRLVGECDDLVNQIHVSTHSRPKAAGSLLTNTAAARHGFNTQPPEGGWRSKTPPRSHPARFNTQPPEGGWFRLFRLSFWIFGFQHTAARRRLVLTTPPSMLSMQFQHTAARRRLDQIYPKMLAHQAFQHTAARRRLAVRLLKLAVQLLFQHTAARRRLAMTHCRNGSHLLFQHTAARRRLVAPIRV